MSPNVIATLLQRYCDVYNVFFIFSSPPCHGFTKTYAHVTCGAVLARSLLGFFVLPPLSWLKWLKRFRWRSHRLALLTVSTCFPVNIRNIKICNQVHAQRLKQCVNPWQCWHSKQSACLLKSCWQVGLTLNLVSSALYFFAFLETINYTHIPVHLHSIMY